MLPVGAYPLCFFRTWSCNEQWYSYLLPHPHTKLSPVFLFINFWNRFTTYFTILPHNLFVIYDQFNPFSCPSSSIWSCSEVHCAPNFWVSRIGEVDCYNFWVIGIGEVDGYNLWVILFDLWKLLFALTKAFPDLILAH